MKTELLAPAGSLEALYGAVENGADAVYMGMPKYNARINAANFKEDDFVRGIDYAHSKDVFVYLTLNTLIKDSEIDDVLEAAGQAANLGVDAFIVQDLGLARLLKEAYPQVQLHASTQMTITDSTGVEFAAKQGFDRVILARELAVDEILSLINLGPEIEVFIHGALCVSYSGQCLMSSRLGGRSGNRGLCAQPCRLPYKLIEDGKKKAEGYLLSTKDILGINRLPQLVEGGVKSLKIEGRMKGTDYVGVVTNVYRKYLDLALEGKPYKVSDNDMEKLLQVFNRGGFSEGWFSHNDHQSKMSIQKPKNWGVPIGRTVKGSNNSQLVELDLTGEIGLGDGIEIWSGKEPSPGGIVTYIKKHKKLAQKAEPKDRVVLGDIKDAFSKDCKVYRTSSKALRDENLNIIKKAERKVNIFGKCEIALGQPASLELWDRQGVRVKVYTDAEVDKAQNRSITKELVLQQLTKTGDSEFKFESLNIEVGNKIFLPMGVLNSLRRRGLAQLSDKRIQNRKRRLPVKRANQELKRIREKGERQVGLLFYDKYESYVDQLVNSLSQKVGLVYIRVDLLDEFLIKKLREKLKVFVWLPAGTHGVGRKIIDDHVAKAMDIGIDGILLGSLGDLKYTHLPIEKRLNYGFNTFNSYFNLAGYMPTVSPELSTREQAMLDGEVIAYGRLQVMTSRFCFSAGSGRCIDCKSKILELEDRKGKRYRILSKLNGCGSTLLGFQPFNHINQAVDAGINQIRIEILDERPEDVIKFINQIQ